jgi:hypothetical protein
MSAVRDAICKHLKADPTVSAIAKGVHPKLAPESSKFPLVVVSAQQPPTAIRTFQTVLAEQSIFLVKAIDQSISPKRASDLAAAIRTSLDQANLVIDGQNNLGIIWIQDVDLVEEYNGQTYQHEGGLYEIYAEAA